MATKYLRAVGGDLTIDAGWSLSSNGPNDTTKPTSVDDVICDTSSGALASGNSSQAKSITFLGASNSFSGNGTITLYGNITLNSTMTFTFTGALIFSHTTGTAIITSASKTWIGSITISGIGGTTVLGDVFNAGSIASIYVTGGTFNFNGYNASVGYLQGYGSSNTRAIIMNTETVSLTATTVNSVLLNFSFTTGLTFTPGTATIKITGNTANQRSIDAGGLALPNVWISSGTATTTFVTWTSVQSLNFTGMGAATIIAGSSPLSISGDVILISTMTWTYTGNITFTAISTGKTITSATKTLTTGIVTFDGVGGGWTLLDNATSSGAWILTNGSLDTGGFAIFCASFSSSNSNIRSLTLGTSTITTTASGTFWNLGTTTNLSLSGASATIKNTNTSATSKTFIGGGQTYGTLWIATRGAGLSHTCNITGDNIFTTIKAA